MKEKEIESAPYFAEREEKAVLDYINSNSAEEKNQIYNEILLEPFRKMIQSILRNLYEMGVLHTACDSDPRIVEEKRSQFPNANYTPSYEEILQNPEIKLKHLVTVKQ